MSQVNDLGNTIQGYTKVVYGQDLEKIPFNQGIVSEMIPFSDAERLGDSYSFPVLLSMEQGVTYNGSAGNSVNLATSIAANTRPATLKGSEVIIRGQITYKLMEAAVKAGEAAFGNSTSLLIENLSESAQKRRELSFLYGQEGLGVVSTNTAGALLITDATWSAATWADTEGAILEAWTTTAQSSTQHNGDLTITGVNLDTKTITVSGTNSSVTTGDVLYFKGARSSTDWNEMAGIHKIATNTGTLFGISAASFSRWKANYTALSSPNTNINMNTLLSNMRKPANRGFKGKASALVPTTGYEVLNTDLAALRRYDSSYSKGKGEAGVESISYHAQTGALDIIPHPLLRDGDIGVLPMGQGVRVGASDITMQLRGGEAGQLFGWVPGTNTYEAQAWYDQAIIFQRPSHMLWIDGVTYP